MLPDRSERQIARTSADSLTRLKAWFDEIAGLLTACAGSARVRVRYYEEGGVKRGDTTVVVSGPPTELSMDGEEGVMQLAPAP